MNCKICIYFLSFIAAIWSHPLVEENNPELGPYYQGDILNPPTEEDKSGINNERYRWPDKTLPYKIGSGFTSNERALIARAVAEISKNTCIKIQNAKSTDRNYVVYTKVESGCASNIGRTGRGEQQIKLASGCFNVGFGTAMHETIHALGFDHEQNRPDRNDFVTINVANIEEKARRNFEQDRSMALTFGVPYDYDSVMHYPKNAFAKSSRLTTIDVKVKGKNIGQRDRLSARDAEKLRRMYKC